MTLEGELVSVRERRTLLGVSISIRSLEALREGARSAIERRSRLIMACANPHSLVVAQTDRDFQQALSACDEVVPDGIGVTLACRLAGLGRVPRITGYDVFQAIMQELQPMGGRVFFFGSSNAVLAQVESRVRQDYPDVHVNALAPPFGNWRPEEDEMLVRKIRDARPDVLWVAMTAPRQEKWVHANMDRLDIPVIGAIGAVFDYYAGTVRRAPSWYRQRGLEWLYRLLREPRRLWRRTLLSAPKFVWLVLRERLAAGS